MVAGALAAVPAVAAGLVSAWPEYCASMAKAVVAALEGILEQRKR